MFDYTGWIVRSTAGHDKGKLFCVVGTKEKFLLLANGKQRKLSAPKRKKLGHVQPLSRGEFSCPALNRLRSGEAVSDRELRGALAAFKEGITLGER